MLNKLLQATSTDPENARRQRLLNILLVGIFFSAILGIGVATYGIITQLWTFSDVALLVLTCLVFLFGVATIYFINRKSGVAAAYVFLFLLLIAYAFSDTPAQISAGRSVFFFSIPIIIASLLIHPLAAFFVAAVGCGIITWAAGTGQQLPDFTVMIGFFMLALVSWLASRSLERALRELRTINVNLDHLVAERTQELAQALARQRIEAGQSKAILDSIADGVIVFDLRGLATVVNPSTESLLDLPAQEVLGSHIVDLSHAKTLDTKNGAILANLLSNPGKHSTSTHIQWGNKSLSVTSAEVSDTASNPIGTVAVFRDYTHEAELDHMKDTFLAIVSHELRTPLNAILGYAEMLKEAVYGKINEKQARASDRILSNTQRLLMIVSDLLDQSQIQAGKMTIHLRPFRPAELLDNLHGVMDKIAIDKNLSLTSELDTSLPYTINGDAARLQQILVNLVNNAIKFTEHGSVRMRVFRTDTLHWAMEVRDTGIGIPANEIPHIFEAFRQVDSTSTRKHGGFGLGLTIVKQLANLMGGDVSVSSVVGSGSTFTVTLPLTVEGEQK
jgi:PAS domain S-box-containing protein